MDEKDEVDEVDEADGKDGMDGVGRGGFPPGCPSPPHSDRHWSGRLIASDLRFPEVGSADINCQSCRQDGVWGLGWLHKHTFMYAFAVGMAPEMSFNEK